MFRYFIALKGALFTQGMGRNDQTNGYLSVKSLYLYYSTVEWLILIWSEGADLFSVNAELIVVPAAMFKILSGIIIEHM